MQIRDAVISDFPAVTAIYNNIVASSTAVYHDAPVTVDHLVVWWQERKKAGYPVLVAEENDQLIGFATFGDFRSWPGYRFTVEGTIHLHPDFRGRGIGRQLLDRLVDAARALGKHMMVAGVDSENLASQHFLLRYGFVESGRLKEVGYKFGHFLDLLFMQYTLTPLE
jgi:L-amino acid N-acyltransferase